MGRQPLITFLLCYRLNHVPDGDNDIFSFFDSFIKYIPELDHSKFEFIIKLDKDDLAAHKLLIELNTLKISYPSLNIYFIVYNRWNGRATLYLNYAYMFSKRNPVSQAIGFVTGDCLVTRNFLPELEQALNSREKDYFIFSSQLDEEKLEYSRRYRHVNHWAGGGLTEPFPIVSAHLLEVIGGMGWQSNIDNWLSLLNVICYHKYNFLLYKKTALPYIELNPIPQKLIGDDYDNAFNLDMYTSISKAPENPYYFNLVEQQALNIYLNAKHEGIIK